MSIGRLGTALVAVVAALGAIAFVPWPGASGAAPAEDAPGMAAQLRHIGRDTTTGRPAWVDDRFIAAREEARERYGQDAREPVPPPPVEGVDIARLVVPALDIDAAVDRFGVDGFGRLDVPQDDATVGWHPAFSTLPGEGGATFMAAHYRYAGQPGVFHELAALAPGSVVIVELTDGRSIRYRVTSTLDYDLGIVDMGALLAGREGVESLTLMTCSGRFDGGTFELRTVVLAERIEE